MSRARDIANLVDANGDIVAGALDNANDASALTTGTLPVARVPYLTNKNLIINGAMQVAQRGTSDSSAAHNSFIVDRFKFSQANVDDLVVTTSQSTDSPDGFSNSYKIEATTAESALGANDLAYVRTILEAQNLQHLKYGTSAAEKITASFFVKASSAGQYTLTLYQDDGAYLVNKTYSIDSANTWEYKTITFPEHTTGAITNDNGFGLSLNWIILAGTDWTSDSGAQGVWGDYANAKWANGHTVTSPFMTTNGTFQITGVQLELGEQATPFEHRSFADELRRCQRYYEHSYPYGTSAGSANGGLGAYHIHAGASRANFYGFVTTRYTVQKRAAATVTVYSYGGTSGQMSNGDSGANIGAVSVIQNAATSFLIRNNSGGTLADQPIIFHYSGDAEL